MNISQDVIRLLMSEDLTLFFEAGRGEAVISATFLSGAEGRSKSKWKMP